MSDQTIRGKDQTIRQSEHKNQTIQKYYFVTNMTYTAAELENFPYAKEGKFIYRTFNKDVPKACRFFLELDSFEAIWVLVWLGRRNPGFLVRFVETLSDFA